MRAAHGQRQGATRGAGAECHQESRRNALEELENIGAGNKFQQSAINKNCMYQASQIYSQNNLQQRQQHCGTVSGNNRSNQAKYADRSNCHNVAYHFVGNLSQTIDGVLQIVSLFTNSGDANAGEQSENDDLQHVSLNHRSQRVGRENVDDNLHQRRSSLSSYLYRFSRHSQASAGLESSAEAQADNDSKSSGQHVPSDGLDTDAANLFDITQAAHANYQAGEYQRNNDHFDHVHKNSAQRPDPGFGKASAFSTQL